MSHRIFLTLLLLTLPAISRAAEGEFQSLFDGKSLAGWAGKEQFWSVKDGAITGQTTAENPTQGNTFLIWKGEVKDFELRLKFKIVGGNSGIQYRSTDKGNSVVNGYQADIDSGDTYIGILYEEGGRGVLAQRGEKVTIGADGKKEVTGKTGDSKEIAAAVKKEDWNEYVVIAKGNQLVQKINGHTTIEVTDNESDKAKASGILALQLHAGPPMTVQFKDIQLKELKQPRPRRAAMDILFPSLSRQRLLALLQWAVLGAAIAAPYGAVHDQVSYSISPEYFTKVKFQQFWYADFGLSPRWYAAVIGALAAGSVGLVSGWILGRMGLDRLPTTVARRELLIAVGFVMLASFIGALIGGLWGAASGAQTLAGWEPWQEELRLDDLPSFVTVAYLHRGSYAGALAGLILAAIRVRHVAQKG